MSDLRSGRASELFYGMTDEEFLNEWYKDDPEWQKSHQNADAARKEQRAARKYQEQQERERKAYELSTQAMIDEKLAMRKRVAIQPVVDYNENAWDWFVDLVKERIRNDPYSLPYRNVYNSLSEKPRDYITPFAEWLLEAPSKDSPYQKVWDTMEHTPNAFDAIKNYYSSAKRISPTQFQLVVDTPSEITVHTVIHLGQMAKEIVDIVKSSAEFVAAASASSVTMGASVALAARVLGSVATSGVSLASEMAETIDDILHYYQEGQIIVTMGPESKSNEDLIGWLVL